MSSQRPPRTLAISPPGAEPVETEAWLERVRPVGVEAVQVRCKTRPDIDVVAVARLARRLLTPPVALLINGRADIAHVVDAEGVHLPAAGVPAAVVRTCLGREAIVGRSTHSIDEVRAAAAEGVDYVTFGPIHPVPGKAFGGGPVPGITGLHSACGLGVPVLALGGVTTVETARECLSVGAWGVAGIRIFTAEGAAELVSAVESHGR